MEALMKAIQSTPIATMLIATGLFIVVLAFVTKVGGVIEVSAEQRRWTLPTGLFLLAIGLVLNFAGAPEASAPPTTSPSSPSSPAAARPDPAKEPTPPALQQLKGDLLAVNLDFSDPRLSAELENSASSYPQFAAGCLKLLSTERLKKKTYFDVVFWNYTEELKGTIHPDAPDGDLNTTMLKAAMVSAYNSRNGGNALSFGDVVEPR
jgi:hypothetical protein